MPAKQKPKVPGSALAPASVPSEAEETGSQQRPAWRGAADAEDGLTPASPRLLERTFAMLSLFAAERPEWTTTELSGMAGLPVPTTHRIVVALQRHGFLVRDPATKRFRLGPAAIALGRAALSSADLPTVAGKLLPKLTKTTGETSLLTVPSDIGDTSVCLLRVESPHQLRLSVEPGRALPFHAGASQKSLLAYLPEVDRERIASGRLEKFCTNTIDTRESLLAEIEHIRQRGWAHSYEETNAGVWGVAVTLLDASEHSVASVGIAGPDVRASAASVRLAVGTVAETATEMATVLGLSCSMEPGAVVSSRDIPRQLRR